jgi:hypothetical protein
MMCNTQAGVSMAHVPVVSVAHSAVTAAAGGRTQLLSAHILVRVIREQHRSQMPVEVVYRGGWELGLLTSVVLAGRVCCGLCTSCDARCREH